MLLALRSQLPTHTAFRVHRTLHSSAICRSGLTNILADSSAPAVQVKSITSAGHIELASGLLLSGACIFLGGKVFLWNISQSKQGMWEGWGKEHFEIFDVVVPKPGIIKSWHVHDSWISDRRGML